MSLPSRRLASILSMSIAAPLIAVSCKDSNTTAPDPNAVAYSFVTVGCNRVAAADTLGNVSTANVAQLNQTFSDIAALPIKPTFLFFTGDLVLGYTNDSTVLDSQLKGWAAIWNASAAKAAGIELIPVPGNHETQNLVKVAVPSAERVWQRDMAAFMTRAGNGPTVGGADGFTTDQSKMSYSFDYKDAHFVTMSTDAVGKDWHAPTAWMTSDIAAAKTKGQKHIFVFGHKPAYSYPSVPTDGLANDTTARRIYWNTLVTNQVEAMFSAHNHVYWRGQPAGGKTWQIIAGNGGTALDATLDTSIPTTGKYFGFTLVQVLNSGRVILKSYGRDVPTTSYVAATSAQATMRDSTELTWQ